MEPSIRCLLHKTLQSLFAGCDSYGEQARSPNVDLVGPVCGKMSYRIIASLTDYLSLDGKPLEKTREDLIFIQVIGGLGVSWTIGRLTGRNWKDWGGNYAVECLSHSLLQFCVEKKVFKNKNLSFGFELLVVVAKEACQLFLQKTRNPSLNLKPYVVHCFGTAFFSCIATSVVQSVFSHAVKASKDWESEVNCLSLYVSGEATGFLLAKSFNAMCGTNLKFNWKASWICSALCVVNWMAFHSNHSPLVKKANPF